jgi:Flp pilus assembly protein TadG
MRHVTLGVPGRPRTRRSGQALVEFVLILPILLLMVFGLIDFARAWSANHALADAAREGTRMLVVNEGSTFTDVEDAIRARLAGARLADSRLTVDFVPDDAPAGRGDAQTVTLTYEYDFWIVGPFMKWTTGSKTVDLVSSITMRGE